MKLPVADSRLCEIRDSIRSRRANWTNSTLAIIDFIEELRLSLDVDQIDSFLRECGLSSNEVGTYMAFAPKLSAHRGRLKNLPLGYDALNALINSDDATVLHALALLEAAGRVGQSEVASLRDVAEDSRMSDNAFEMGMRARRVHEACLARASANAREFEASVKQLHNLMQDHTEQRTYLWDYEEYVRNDVLPEDLDNEEVKEFVEKWPEVEAAGNSFLEQKEAEIVGKAAELLKEFDLLFPGASIPKEDWLQVVGEDLTSRYLAESRYALEVLTRGGFWGGFPSEQSEHYAWDALDALSYLGGFRREKPSFKRLAPRPVKKLNAISVGSASGAEALGVDLAGFRVCASYLAIPTGDETIKANRRDWTPSTISLDDPALVFDMMHKVQRYGSADLVFGPLPGRPFTEKGAGEHDPEQRFTRAFEIVAELRPSAFFFESSESFLWPGHSAFRSRLIWQANELGYHVDDIVKVDASHYGIVQDRTRSVFIGIQKNAPSHLRSLVLAEPITLTVGEVVADAAFPHLKEIQAAPAEARSPGEKKYLDWASKWLRWHGDTTTVPDLHTLLAPRRTRANIEKWQTEFGFLVGADEVVEPHPLLEYRSVPLSIPVLKRLQGIPDDWVFAGTYDEQVEQICNTIPPVISRVIAHSIHGALTGDVIDLDRAARMEIHSNRPRKGFRIASLATSSNPAALRSRAWRDHVCGEDDG